MIKSKVSARLFLVILAFFAVITVFSSVSIPTINTVYAESNIEDNLNGQTDTSTPSDSGSNMFDDIKNQEIDENDQGVADWLKDRRGVTSEQLSTASNTLGPVTTIIGYITGGIIILVVAGVVCITALDLLYIAIPPVRNVLYKAGTDGTGGYTGGFGAGGYGRGFGGMGAMGAGGAAGGSKKPTQWVSDEAVACAAMLGGSAQSANGMGVMGTQQGQAQPTTKSVIAMYFRKRIFFMILLALCIIVLTSSSLMNCGVNLAEWFIKIVNMINGKMSA
jgi:hypothetical protein